MRVGFDAHMVGQRETGNETYALGLLHGFDQIGFPLDAYAVASLPSSIHRTHRIRPSMAALRIPLGIPTIAIRDRLDVFHATYVLPPMLPCPAVVTVHDITFALYPEWFSPRVHQMLSVLVPLAMRRAAWVITISEHTRKDIIERYGVTPQKIRVTHLAPRPAFSSQDDVASVGPRSSLASGEPFFLFVGNVEPRKNIETVLQALRLLEDQGTNVRLIVAGKPGFHFDRIVRVVEQLGLEDWVRFAGYVRDADLKRLYATCTALVHPALYEGFGLTPLEAMTQGAPVIAANTSSIPEVVGDAAILLDPYDVEGWMEALNGVLERQELRENLAQRGLQQSQRFSWERCARETLAVYESTARKAA